MFFTIHIALYSSNKSFLEETVFSYQKYITQDYAKILFFKSHSTNVKEEKVNFLKMSEVCRALGYMLRYNSVEDGFFEQPLVKKAKYEFIKQAHSNFVEIAVTPSDALLLKYWDRDVTSWKLGSWGIIFAGKKYPFYRHCTIKKSNILGFLNRIVKEEGNALLSGKRVIYHSTNKELYILMKIQALILEYKNKQKYPYFLPLRNPALTSYVPDEDQITLRQKFLEQGVKNDHGPREKYHLLSGNHSILSNLDCQFTGESALQFLISRWNVNPPNLFFKFELRNIFVKNGMQHFYEKNKRALKSLILDGSYGILLRLEFEPDLFEKACYLSQPYGVHGIELTARNEPDITNSCMNDIIKYPESIDNLDTIQFRVVLDHDLLLNPNNKATQEKFKVSAYAVNQKSLDDFNREVTKIFDNYCF